MGTKLKSFGIKSKIRVRRRLFFEFLRRIEDFYQLVNVYFINSSTATPSPRFRKIAMGDFARKVQGNNPPVAFVVGNRDGLCEVKKTV